MNRWEKDEGKPDGEQCFRLAKLFGISIDELLYDDLSKKLMFKEVIQDLVIEEMISNKKTNSPTNKLKINKDKIRL